MAEKESNIQAHPKQAFIGMNLNSLASQMKPGQLSYALNAVVENFDGNQTSYQNEQANTECATFPVGFHVIGRLNIIEDQIKIFWLVNPTTGSSQIGKVVDCLYSKIVDPVCLNLHIDYPILKAIYRKRDCGTEVYWVDGRNRLRYLNLDDLPYKVIKGEDNCDDVITEEIDCNQMNVQPNFALPQIDIIDVDSDGELTAGTYQFAVQYTDALGIEGYTSYYSVTNPLPIFDPHKITLDFNYKVGKSINISISNLDTSGLFEYVNLAVIKTVNNIPAVELVGTFHINRSTLDIVYTGQSQTDTKLSINDIFAKYDVYDVARDLTVAQDTLVVANLTTHQRISYQEIASNMKVLWQTWRMPKDSFKDELISTYLKGYMGDEIYPLEVVFLLANGVQTDGFHIPGRKALPSDLVIVSGNDVIDAEALDCEPHVTVKPRWQVYNTANVAGYEKVYTDFLTGITPASCPNPKVCGVINIDPTDPECYSGPFQYGDMAYWESTDVYPCNDIYGELEGQPIRHHKWPDSLVAHIHDGEGFIYSKGFKIDLQQIIDLIKGSNLSQAEKDAIQGIKIVRGNRANNKSIVAKGLINNVGKYDRDEQTYFYPNYPFNDLRADPFISTVQSTDDSGDNEDTRLQGFNSDDSKKRYTLHSPDTSFFQPTLGNILKLETAEYGTSRGHFQLVQDHSRYRFLSSGSYVTALIVAAAIGVISSAPVTGNAFNGTAAFTAFNSFLSIIEKLTPKQNFAYQFNNVGNYTSFKAIPNSGNKQRGTDLEVYMQPGMVALGDDFTVNNFQRESSIYLRTTKTLPYPNEVPTIPEDQSRYINSDVDCGSNITERNISSYYASLKKEFANQYGQLYSYQTIDTGYQFLIDLDKVYEPDKKWMSVYGGDVFISRFAYKSKLPFFIDNRVGLPDESDVEYNELGNVAYPIFWMSTDSTSDSGGGSGGLLAPFKALFGVKINNFDCKQNKFFFQKGKFYLFAYGIPYFYTESEVNVDLRQAFNQSEGDFFPRVSSDIPDEWLQEKNTTIKQDNTYYYNKTYSKQNKENFFTHLPDDWEQDDCIINFPFRVIFSPDWYLFKPSARIDLPENYGNLTSIDGIENKQVLVRFEQKTLLYNALLTAPTSAADVYLGQSLFAEGVPPLDYADTDLGHIGSQHKFLLKTEYGHITIDAIRGKVFLLQGQSAEELTKDTEYQQVSKFFMQYLPFQIKKAFPEVNIDNHYKDLGLTGVYDSRYGRLILTKKDYKPLSSDIVYSSGKFYVGQEEIQLSNTEYFCNYSFTISYDLQNGAWISFHTYIPNYYIGDTNVFYTGINGTTSSIWEHNSEFTKFNNFYGAIAPYVIEYPYSRQFNDEILQNIKDYSRVLKYTDFREFVETDEDYFNKMVIYSNQQCSGLLELEDKPRNNLSLSQKYPVYNIDSKTVTFTKSNSFYQVNTFWDMVMDTKKPIWLQSCDNLSIYKELNQDNMDYSKRSRRKSPFRSKELKIRYILDNQDDIKIVSVFTVAPTMQSYK